MNKNKLTQLVFVPMVISILIGNSSINGGITTNQTTGLQVGDWFYFDVRYEGVNNVTMDERIDSETLSLNDFSDCTQCITVYDNQHLFSNDGWRVGRINNEVFTEWALSALNDSIIVNNPVSQNFNDLIGFDPLLKQTQTATQKYNSTNKGYNFNFVNESFIDGYLSQISNSSSTNLVTYVYDGTETYFINGYFIEIYRYYERDDRWSSRGSSLSTNYNSEGQLYQIYKSVTNDTGDFFQVIDVAVNGTQTLVEEYISLWADQDPNQRYVTNYLHKYSPDLHVVVNELFLLGGQNRILLEYNVQDFDAATLAPQTFLITKEVTVTEQGDETTYTETAITTVAEITKIETKTTTTAETETTQGASTLSVLGWWIAFIPIITIIRWRNRNSN